ncbi:hypothetical protein, partial [Roseovarius sp. D22-M7]|uniref:hypothetical protein n=1 Tax=Roseovarius sp. D22-M7 TaxID=3127116 RepID=UPI003010487F
GSGRGMACSYSPCNRMDSRCESSTVKVVQQRRLTIIPLLVGLRGLGGLWFMLTNDIQIEAYAATGTFILYVLMTAAAYGLFIRIWKLDQPRKNTHTEAKDTL